MSGSDANTEFGALLEPRSLISHKRASRALGNENLSRDVVPARRPLGRCSAMAVSFSLLEQSTATVATRITTRIYYQANM